MRPACLHLVLFTGLLIVSASSTPAALSVYVPPSDLAGRAPLVLEGTVIRTASGLDPMTGALATYVTLDVTMVHRGPGDLERVVIREPGGEFGGLVHVVDAVPVYREGEDVFVFLEGAGDGALRTAGMFFGKFNLAKSERGGSRRAVRDLDGKGRILGRPTRIPESFRASDLVSLTASTRFRSPAMGGRGSRHRRSGRPEAARSEWSALPPELSRVRWNQARYRSGDDPPRAGADRESGSLASSPGDPGPYHAKFTTLSSSSPTRWYEVDTGQALSIDIQRTDDPLGDGAAAVAEIERAFAAWTDVLEARIALQTGNDNANFTGANPDSSPAAVYPPGHIVLFGDPYNDISDPTGCSGVLAIGGYWRSGSTGAEINGTTFYRALRLYVIFNNDFECFLALPGNLAEVATHEIGHGIGLGHSTVPDAIMRSSAYGAGRGTRLGDDDRDAVHCIYPHTFTVDWPDGGETLTAGQSYDILWSATGESGTDEGTLDVEYSDDGGDSWNTISGQTNNDGLAQWTVPPGSGTEYLVRVVRHNRVTPTPPPFPSECSVDTSDGNFSVLAEVSVAGSVPDGAVGDPLRVDRSFGDLITVSWDSSCSADADDYALYQGSLSALRSGRWDHEPVTCSAGADLTETFLPDPADGYYLVSPLAGSAEGTMGEDGNGADRPESASACAAREADSSCP